MMSMGMDTLFPFFLWRKKVGEGAGGSYLGEGWEGRKGTVGSLLHPSPPPRPQPVERSHNSWEENKIKEATKGNEFPV